MSSLAIGCIVFACILGGIVLGMLLRSMLPEEHLSSESRDVIKLGMGLIGTMTALVLGLLVASAKSSYDTQRNGLAQLAGNVIFIDRILVRYGLKSKDAADVKDAREMLRTSVADMLQRTWPNENPQGGQEKTKSGTEGRYEAFYTKLDELKPNTDTQRALQALAMKTASDVGQSRWVLFAQKGGSIPTPFLVVMVSWVALLFASFSLFAPRNATVFVTLLVSALVISSALFLILELDRPFDGIIQISSDPLRNALEQLGR
jgi:hypothetical protein